MDVPTIDELAQTVANMTLEMGGHSGSLWVYQETDMHIIVLSDMPPLHALRCAKLRDLARGSRRRNRHKGALTDVFLVNEAWMVQSTEQRLNVEPLPSKHPDRIEVLIVAHYNLSSQIADVRIFEMIRSGNVLDLKNLYEGDDKPDFVQAYLLDHFVKGWG